MAAERTMTRILALLAAMFLAGCDDRGPLIDRQEADPKYELTYVAGGFIAGSVYRFTDAEAGVTCWVTGRGISCLPTHSTQETR